VRARATSSENFRANPAGRKVKSMCGGFGLGKPDPHTNRRIPPVPAIGDVERLEPTHGREPQMTRSPSPAPRERDRPALKAKGAAPRPRLSFVVDSSAHAGSRRRSKIGDAATKRANAERSSTREPELRRATAERSYVHEVGTRTRRRSDRTWARREREHAQ